MTYVAASLMNRAGTLYNNALGYIDSLEEATQCGIDWAVNKTGTSRNELLIYATVPAFFLKTFTQPYYSQGSLSTSERWVISTIALASIPCRGTSKIIHVSQLILGLGITFYPIFTADTCNTSDIKLVDELLVIASVWGTFCYTLFGSKPDGSLAARTKNIISENLRQWMYRDLINKKDLKALMPNVILDLSRLFVFRSIVSLQPKDVSDLITLNWAKSNTDHESLENRQARKENTKILKELKEKIKKIDACQFEKKLVSGTTNEQTSTLEQEIFKEISLLANLSKGNLRVLLELALNTLENNKKNTHGNSK